MADIRTKTSSLEDTRIMRVRVGKYGHLLLFKNLTDKQPFLRIDPNYMFDGDGDRFDINSPIDKRDFD